MGEKGNLAQATNAGGAVARATTSTVGLGNAASGSGGGSLLENLTDKAMDRAQDVGLGREGVVGDEEAGDEQEGSA
jgi:hypothetical protein